MMRSRGETSSGNVPELKVVMVGDVNVGKTSICTRFSQDRFSEKVSQTIGSSCSFKEMDGENGARVKFSLWDTAGQEAYHSMVPVYFRQSAAVVLVYDLSSPKSLEGVKKWVVQIRDHAPEKVIVVLVGNKSDLDQRVCDEDVLEAAVDCGALHIKVSAKTGHNINAIFQKILDQYEKKGGFAAPTPNTVKINQPGNGGQKPSRCPC